MIYNKRVDFSQERIQLSCADRRELGFSGSSDFGQIRSQHSRNGTESSHHFSELLASELETSWMGGESDNIPVRLTLRLQHRW